MVNPFAVASPSARNVLFVHLDLGIGGAEQLIVHAARGLGRRGHNVEIWTTFFDSQRCFPGLKQVGSSQDFFFEQKDKSYVPVRLFGAWIPRSIGGRLTVLCSVLRMSWLCVVLVAAYVTGLLREQQLYPDVIVNDQVAHVNPLLRYFAAPLLRFISFHPSKPSLIFYCHFPDLLLCTDRSSMLKRLYRGLFDTLEGATMFCCDRLLVNSEYTKKVFEQTFIENKTHVLEVLYPPCDLEEVDEFLSLDLDGMRKKMKGQLTRSGGRLDLVEKILEGADFFLSLNRYERKKAVHLAVEGHARLEREKRPLLVIAGGYDDRVEENRLIFNELVQLAKNLGTENEVLFLISVENEARLWLLKKARSVVYTPENEHFGMVVCESMAAGTLVVASKSGGPKESVGAVGGFLVEEQTGRGFGDGMENILKLDVRNLRELEKAARKRVEDKFSLNSFVEKLETIVLEETQR